jgi:CO dehydrogenase nickel-insertion accessory protein CooC1
MALPLKKGGFYLLIVAHNNKGGQGKSTICALITSYLLSNPKNEGLIVACDLDTTQQNFRSLIEGYNISSYNNLSEVPTGIICVVDTPSDLGKSIEAIKAADILIVPIIIGAHAIQGFSRVKEIRGDKDLRVVLNQWENSAITRAGEEQLALKGVTVTAKIPRYLRLHYNLDSKQDWYTGFRSLERGKIIKAIAQLIKVGG